MNKKKRRMHEWINTYMAKSKGKGIQYKNQEIEKKNKTKKIANEFEKVDSGMRSRRREHTSTK